MIKSLKTYINFIEILILHFSIKEPLMIGKDDILPDRFDIVPA